jgi:hypothetical protein
MAQRPTREEVKAAEATLARMEASPTRSTTFGLGAYYEHWLENNGCSPGAHAELVALRVLLADREAQIVELRKDADMALWASAFG